MRSDVKVSCGYFRDRGNIMKSDGVFPVNTVERGCPGAGVGGGEKGERGREEVDMAFSWMGLTSLSKA
jgi:hypothetical protein